MVRGIDTFYREREDIIVISSLSLYFSYKFAFRVYFKFFKLNRKKLTRKLFKLILNLSTNLQQELYFGREMFI